MVLEGADGEPLDLGEHRRRRWRGEDLGDPAVDDVGDHRHRGGVDPPPPDVLAEVERLAIRALEYHSERRLRSAALL